jgi:hypothetical protein
MSSSIFSNFSLSSLFSNCAFFRSSLNGLTISLSTNF